MKNKLIALSLLPILVLASGCSNNKKTAPKKYKNEVSYEEFKEQLNALPKFEELETLDFEATTNIYLIGRFGLKRENKDLVSETNDVTQESNGKYDVDNDVALVDTKATGKATSVDKRGAEYNIDLAKHIKRQFQKEVINEVEVTARIDAQNKVYYNGGAYESHKPINEVANYFYSAALPMVSATGEYEYLTPEEKANYKFFVDKGLFTIEYNHTETEDLKSNETVYATQTTVTKEIAQVQVDSKDDKITGAYGYMYAETSETRTFVLDYSNYLKGDVDETIEKTIIASNIKVKKVELAKINLSDYTLYPKDISDDVGF